MPKSAHFPYSAAASCEIVIVSAASHALRLAAEAHGHVSSGPSRAAKLQEMKALGGARLSAARGIMNTDLVIRLGHMDGGSCFFGARLEHSAYY